MRTKEPSGTRAWADAWARALAANIGTITPDGRHITGHRVQLYGDSRSRWCVVELWHYANDASLGQFGGDCALLLNEEMPP